MKRIALILSILWVAALATTSVPALASGGAAATHACAMASCPPDCCADDCACCVGGACTCASASCTCCAGGSCAKAADKKCETKCAEGCGTMKQENK